MHSINWNDNLYPDAIFHERRRHSWHIILEIFLLKIHPHTPKRPLLGNAFNWTVVRGVNVKIPFTAKPTLTHSSTLFPLEPFLQFRLDRRRRKCFFFLSSKSTGEENCFLGILHTLGKFSETPPPHHTLGQNNPNPCRVLMNSLHVYKSSSPWGEGCFGGKTLPENANPC